MQSAGKLLPTACGILLEILFKRQVCGCKGAGLAQDEVRVFAKPPRQRRRPAREQPRDSHVRVLKMVEKPVGRLSAWLKQAKYFFRMRVLLSSCTLPMQVLTPNGLQSLEGLEIDDNLAAAPVEDAEELLSTDEAEEANMTLAAWLQHQFCN